LSAGYAPPRAPLGDARPPAHHEHLALIEGHCAVPQLDVERACESKEEIVGVVVLVPMERPLKLGDHNVVTVVGRNGTWGEPVGKSRELLGEISGHAYHGFLSRQPRLVEP